MNLRTFTLGALLLLAASGLGLAGERARGNVVEYQGKLYVLQPSNNSAHASYGTFAGAKPREVFREMVMGAKAHTDLWDKVDAIYEVKGSAEELAALKDLELQWIDIEGTATQTSDELSEDPQKRKIKTLEIDTFHNPTLTDTRQRLRRNWEWASSVSSVGSQTWTFQQDLTFGGAELFGPGRAELENYMPILLTPPVSTVSTRPAVTSGMLLGPKVNVRGYVHRSPQGRRFVALRPLETVADVSGSGMTAVSAPGASLPLPKIGGGLPAPVVVGGPGAATPLGKPVVSGPGAATPLGKTTPGSNPMGPGASTPLGKTNPGSTSVPASNPAVTPVTNPSTPAGPTIVTTPLTKKPGMVSSINP